MSPAIQMFGPGAQDAAAVERILRSLPDWFGREDALTEYIDDSRKYSTFLARVGGSPEAFLTLRQHAQRAWEIHCVGVHAHRRGMGLGTQLLAHGESWLRSAGAKWLQVKTIAESHPSKAYAQTRAFWAARGFEPLETFTSLWGPETPVLQLVKIL